MTRCLSVNGLIVLLSILLQGNVEAQNVHWHTLHKEYNEGAVIYRNSELVDTAIWFDIELKSIYYNPHLLIENLSCGEDLMLEIFDSAPTNSKIPTPIRSRNLKRGATQISLKGLVPDRRYFLRIYSSREGVGRFKFFYGGAYYAVPCHQEVNTHSAERTPAVIVLKQYEQERCIDDCTEYCRRQVPRFRSAFISRKIKHYVIRSPLPGELVRVSLSSADLVYLELWGVERSTGRTYKIAGQSNRFGDIDLRYVPIHAFGELYISVYGLSYEIVHYRLCVEYLPFRNSCVDYDMPGDSLMVVATSMGSPPEGPFVPGEIITFKYVLQRWVPVRDNWPHTFAVTLGGPWGVYTDTTDNPFAEVIERVNRKQGYAWVDSDTLDIFQYDIPVRFVGRGLYPLAETLPYDEEFSMGWGIRPKYSVFRADSPLVELMFQLKVPDSLDCVDSIGAGLQVRIFTDYQTGSYSVGGCTDNVLEKSFVIKCCPSGDTLYALVDDVCRGDSLEVRVHHGGLDTPIYVRKYRMDGTFTTYRVDSASLHIPVEPGDWDAENYGRVAVFSASPLARACRDTLWYSYRVWEPPAIEVVDTVERCIGDTIVLEQLLVQNEEAFVAGFAASEKGVVQWKGSGVQIDDAGNRGIVQRAEGYLVVERSDAKGCRSTDTVQVVGHASQVRYAGLQEEYRICRGTRTIDLHWKASDQPQWQLPDGSVVGGEKLSASEPGQYRLILVDRRGCKAARSFRVINANIPDTVWLDPCTIDEGEIHRLVRTAESSGDSCVPNKVYRVREDVDCNRTCRQKLRLLPNPVQQQVHLLSLFDEAVEYLVYDDHWRIYKTGVLYPGVNRLDVPRVSANLYVYIRTRQCQVVKKLTVIK